MSNLFSVWNYNYKPINRMKGRVCLYIPFSLRKTFDICNVLLASSLHPISLTGNADMLCIKFIYSEACMEW